MRDFATLFNERPMLNPKAAVADNTAQVSAIIDLAGYQGAVVRIHSGDIADADTVLTTLLEHGDAANLSDAAAVPDANLIGSEALAGLAFGDDNKIRKLGYIGPKRYLRLTVTPANNTGNIFLEASCLLFAGRYNPQANPPA